VFGHDESHHRHVKFVHILGTVTQVSHFEPSTWTQWWNLTDQVAIRGLATSPGLYKVRVIGERNLAYIGQTSRLRQRLSSLRALYRDEIPLNDPHTAAPCLWVLRTESGADFEFSVCSAVVDVPMRKAAECVEVSLHRQSFGCSPTANFGRMPDGWVKSSGNNAAVRARGGPFPGHPDERAHRSEDFPCVIDTKEDVVSAMWAGFEWSAWSDAGLAPNGPGVYRIRHRDTNSLSYIGQGNISARLRSHKRKGGDPTHRQGIAFMGDVQASWVALPETSQQQLLEIECDLIASHMLVHGTPPSAQFLG
jgi:hypothetical protein